MADEKSTTTATAATVQKKAVTKKKITIPRGVPKGGRTWKTTTPAKK